MTRPFPPPTERQLEVLRFIAAGIVLERRPPRFSEIGAHFGITSQNGVNDHVRALIRKGLLLKLKTKNNWGESRGLRLTMLGLAAAGWKQCSVCDGLGAVACDG